MVAALIAFALRLLSWTWRVEQPPWPTSGPCVVAFWHGDQLPMIALHRGRGLVGVASLSADGAIVAGVLIRLGYGVIRGSTSRGGAEAIWRLREAIRAGRSPALAVDGPRGPAGSVRGGAEQLARTMDVPVVFGRVVAHGWRARSWDRFVVPWPFARVRVEYGLWRASEARGLAEAMSMLPPVSLAGETGPRTGPVR
jgi:lysophospholipid acyltransferase (LPLAT)-like uncharacterized protein